LIRGGVLGCHLALVPIVVAVPTRLRCRKPGFALIVGSRWRKKPPQARKEQLLLAMFTNYFENAIMNKGRHFNHKEIVVFSLIRRKKRQ
jgi:hypothetical protein